MKHLHSGFIAEHTMNQNKKIAELNKEIEQLKEKRNRYRRCLVFLQISDANSAVKDRTIEQALKGK